MECRNEGLILRGKYGFHEIAGRQCRSRLRGSAADTFAHLLSAEFDCESALEDDEKW